ncbi:MAG: DUF29 domain-containing protein [Gammaproteobacteria bacterium]|nr:DUF29 domain-containing protein [Gammaproteobacteria bacterium]
MPDDLYERDFLSWSEQQADLLRRLAAGELVNEAVDWPHVIEEVEDVGSFLVQAITHLMKIRLQPGGPVAHWADEVDQFLDEAASRITPAVRRRVDLDSVYKRALRRMRRHLVSDATPLPRACPYTLDELLAEEPDIYALVAKLDTEPHAG